MNIIYYYLGWSEPEIKPVLNDKDIDIITLHDELLNFNINKLKKTKKKTELKKIDSVETIDYNFSSDDEYINDEELTIEDIVNRGYILLGLDPKN